MTDNVSQLISGYLDGVLTDEQHDELSGWIEADPAHANQFAKAVLLDNRLHAEINAGPYKNSYKNTTTSVQAPEARRFDRRIGYGIVSALAASLLIAVGIGFWTPQKDEQRLATDDRAIPTESKFVAVAQIVDADWDGDTTLRIGDRLSARTIRLRSGIVRLAFDDGVEVTLQGPAEYDLLGPGKTRLTSGLLTANVPAGAEGFTVDTPSAEVVDLGTSFGIDIQEDGVERVSVFEGEVEVTLPDSTDKKLIKEGEAVRVQSGRQIERVEFDGEPFSKVWPVSSGIEKSTEAFRFVPPWPPQLRFVRSDHDIYLVPEGHVATLSRPLRVNMTEPGEYVTEDTLTVSEIPVGQRLRSFMLFFHPEISGRRQPDKQVTGSITFDSPVLGLIVLQEELQASVRRFGRFGPRDVREGHQLELTGEEDSDVITLSEDRRTITLKLTSQARFAELTRVLVDASQPDQQRN